MPEGRTAGTRFINPYTFSRIPKNEDTAGRRTAPSGHGRLGDGRTCGVLEVELTARSPLLLRNAYDGEDGLFPHRRIPALGGPAPYLPGSSLAGAVRSLHEMMAGGCLRVFDRKFRPGYRDPVRARPSGWRLARVDRVDEDGRPDRMQLSEVPAVWVESTTLANALGGPEELRTGVRFTVPAGSDATEEVLGRRQLKDYRAVVAGGPSVVLLTDSRTRTKTRGGARGADRSPGRYFCATGRLEDHARPVEFDPDVWESHLDAVDQTDDMRRFRQDPGSDDAKPHWIDVFHPGSPQQLLGRRMAARRRMYEDQVVWVLPRFDGDGLHIADMALAVVWRHSGGGHPAEERVPEHALACTDPQRLCPSCRIFGSADEESGGPGGPAGIRAYRGHVRFGDALPGSPCGTRVEYLPPMGAPKPGAGQFYLKYHAPSEGGTAEKGAAPLREWGSEGDRDREGVRGLRGRKQYWLTENHGDRPYFRATAPSPRVFHEKVYKPDNQMLSKAQSVPAGSVFTARVHFENLSDDELGGLLCALDPGLLLAAHQNGKDAEPRAYGWAVGGGRPLGFGSVTSRVTVVSLDTAASRYLGAPPPPLTAERAVTAFRRSVADDLKDIWKRELTKILRLDWAAPHQVWYPPSGPLPEPAAPLSPESLLPSFSFWKETSGSRAETVAFPYRQLPAASYSDPAMDIVEQGNRKGRRK
ncbi:RAMP superfamily CRISPR-associated protein [Streptomyces sp. NBC_00102]|uniref:RAMP superfamily CRISPR-associated protein n=1 Tax=Streptomyces sp. NBC_00102 TaxID=2975652 RepID=UPI002259BCA9|nr:RAMP superfamily CRISPR-associated protein [Streptomyces sp. NBC_00102]MCX5400807.1 RAMP superfamily CRISPR-associated protein [Streptomyces sp. NBC_00102]